MTTIELLMERGFNISIVEVRYGDGYVCFMADTEAVSVISDAITGGDILNENTQYLESGWYPYAIGQTVEGALQALKEKIKEQTAGVEGHIYRTACAVGSSEIATAGNLFSVVRWDTQVSAFYQKWESIEWTSQ